MTQYPPAYGDIAMFGPIPDAFVILPGGNLDPNSAHLIPEDAPLEPIVFPEVSTDLEIQRQYEMLMMKGLSHDESVRTAVCFFLDIADIEDALREFGGTSKLDHYARCRAKGCAHSLAMCLASRKFPGVKTDAVFNEGKFSGDSGKLGVKEQWLQDQAKAAGVSTNGKWYCSGLADYPGDPTAWVDSRGDVLRIAREKNMTVGGYVEHKGHEVEPVEDIPLADDLLEAEVADIVSENPEVNAEQVRDELWQLRTGAVDPNPLRVQE